MKAIAGGLLLAGGAQAEVPQPIGPFSAVELRQYTLHEGQRDTLIELFEREFVESQEAVGMKVIGTFTDLDRPHHFVWLRGFRDMSSRAAGLAAFYGGPVWQAHRSAANATMIDSDNVLLLRPPSASAGFAAGGLRPAPGEARQAGLIVATIYYLRGPAADAVALFETQVRPKLQASGVTPLAWFVPETAPNNFPRLPVRQGERLMIWFARFSVADDYIAGQTAIERAAAPLTTLLDRPPEVLRLRPTSRSELR